MANHHSRLLLAAILAGALALPSALRAEPDQTDNSLFAARADRQWDGSYDGDHDRDERRGMHRKGKDHYNRDYNDHDYGRDRGKRHDKYDRKRGPRKMDRDDFRKGQQGRQPGEPFGQRPEGMGRPDKPFQGHPDGMRPEGMKPGNMPFQNGRPGAESMPAPGDPGHGQPNWMHQGGTHPGAR